MLNQLINYRFRPTALALSLSLLAGNALATDFVITQPVTSQNGDGQDIDGDGALDNVNLIAGDSITLSSSGTITIPIASGAEGIETGANDIDVYVDGSIITSGVESYGVSINGDDSLVELAGSISTSGLNSIGIRNNGDSTQINVSGSIVTTANGADGIALIDGTHGSSIVVNGSITTSGVGASGIWVGDQDANGVNLSNNNSISVVGNIAVTGNRAHALRNNGNSNVYHIYGSISATVDADVVINNYNGLNNLFILHDGVRVIGLMQTYGDAATSANLHFDVGSSMSYIYSLQTSETGVDLINPWSLKDLDRRALVEDFNVATGTGSAMAAGIGNAETADELQFDRLSQLNNSLLNRADHYSYQDGKRQAWIDPFYSRSDRDADNSDATIEDYESSSYGITAGFPTLLSGKDVDVILGVQNTALDIHDKTQEIDVTSFKAGLYFPELASYDDVRITGKALVGYNQHDMTRQVLVNTNTTTGITNYTADYNSWEVTTGIDAQLKRPVNTSGTQLIAGAGLDLVYEAIESYSETANFAWDSRKVLQGVANASLGFTHKHHSGVVSHAIATVKHRNVLSGKTTDYSINDTAVSFSGGDFSDTIAQLNVGATYQAKDDVQLTLDVNASQSSNDITNMGAAAKVSWRF